MNPGWLLKTRSPSSFIRRNACRPSSELRSMFHLPMVQRRYVITSPGLLPCYGTTITDLCRNVGNGEIAISGKRYIGISENALSDFPTSRIAPDLTHKHPRG